MSKVVQGSLASFNQTTNRVSFPSSSTSSSSSPLLSPLIPTPFSTPPPPSVLLCFLA